MKYTEREHDRLAARECDPLFQTVITGGLMLPGLRSLAAVLIITATPCLAQEFEQPPVTPADQLLGPQAQGANYSVDPTVHGDGLMHLYTLTAAGAMYQVAGDTLMQERIRELAALAQLNAMSKSDVFLKSLSQSAQRPVQFGKDLINDPDATMKRAASGVSRMFDRVGTGIKNKKASRDTTLGSVLGVDGARRQLAVQLGVDPYTDFPPLAAALNDIATASAMGGLSVKALTMAIPGGVGLAVSSTSAVESIESALAQNTSAEIAAMVKGQLVALRVPEATADRLILNQVYSPADLLIIAQALTMLNADDSAIFVDRAADAMTRDEAYFQRVRARVLAERGPALGIRAFVDVGGFPLNRLEDGRILALFPFDEVAWTDSVGTTFEAVAAALPPDSGTPVLAVTGRLTDLAAANVAASGWTVLPLD